MFSEKCRCSEGFVKGSRKLEGKKGKPVEKEKSFA